MPLHTRENQRTTFKSQFSSSPCEFWGLKLKSQTLLKANAFAS